MFVRNLRAHHRRNHQRQDGRGQLLGLLRCLRALLHMSPRIRAPGCWPHGGHEPLVTNARARHGPRRGSLAAGLAIGIVGDAGVP